MGLDLDNSYKSAQNKLSALKTFTDAKSSIDKSSQEMQNQLTPNFDLTKFQDQAKELEQKIRKKAQSQFEKILGLLLTQKGSGQDTMKFLLKKMMRAIQTLKSKVSDILVKCFMKFLGCDVNQIFDTSIPVWIKVSSIDLFDILKINPQEKVGKLLYENTPYTASAIPRSTNLGLYDFIQHSGNVYEYAGYSSNKLFKIQYFQTNTNTGDSNGWYKVTFLASTPSQVIKFFSDYYKTISIIDIKTLISNLMEAIFGFISIKLKSGSIKIDDTTKFGLIIQRILGLCFDEEQEISVSGQAKTSEIDDTTDSFYDVVGMDVSIIEERTNQIQRGVITLEKIGRAHV